MNQYTPAAQLNYVPCEMAHCHAKRHLSEELAHAAEASASAAKALRTALHDKQTQAMEDAERTSKACGKARRALQAHILKHRC